MKSFKIIVVFLLVQLLPQFTYAQNIEIDVNLNIKHSVDGVSDFGRERHITLHSTPTDPDWNGEEDKLHYLMQDLDVYFGRDNGSSTWKFKLTPEDPSRPAKADLNWMETEGERLKTLYDTKMLAHQYENKGQMIMGTNPHPLYPTLSWNGDGVTSTGWQPYDVDTSAEWVTEYLDKYFAKNNGESGEPMPTYWEVINEPDIIMMTGHMTCTSQEKIWEYHNLVAEGVKARLGDLAPKIGGMTWGLHDFYKPDGLSRFDQNYLDQWLSGDGIATYHNMMDTEVVATRTSAWYQWDVMWQGFIDTAGENMDFYGVHIYDWPKWKYENSGQNSIRAGGHVEAMFDILEWYDYFKLGDKKDIVLSEYGSVSAYQQEYPNADRKRLDWESLKPFNSMLMQFLERPSQVVLSMPFTPVKAEWGDYTVGNTLHRYPYTMMVETSEDNWEWSEYIKFYELWSDVKGTRVDTKSNNIDIQVDSYIDGQHVYLVLNNLTRIEQNLNLNIYDDYASEIENIKLKHLYLDENLGTDGEPVLSISNLAAMPGLVKIGAEATIVIDYKFKSAIAIDQTSVENKFMGERLGTGTNAIGGSMFRVTQVPSINTNVNNIQVPIIGEAILRISGSFWSSHMYPSSVTVNGNALTINNNWRGVEEDNGTNKFFGVMEIPVPIEYLSQDNTVVVNMPNNADFTSVMIQTWDFSKKPSRFDDATSQIGLTAIGLGDDISLMEGQTEALAVTFTPENATNKTITWSSSNDAIASIDNLGVVTALTTGNATITAISTDGNHNDSMIVTVTPFAVIAVNSISITEGSTIEVPHFVTTQLIAITNPINATEQNITWSSSDSSIVDVDYNSGKITGKVIFGSATVTASLTDPNNTNTVHIATITVTVGTNGIFNETTGVLVSPSSKTLTLDGEVVQLHAEVMPSNATLNTVTWSTSNSNVVTVNNSGIGTAVSDGVATITATTDRGSYTSSSEITVSTTPSGNVLIIEAEDFETTGGTFNDGSVPLGVNATTIGINYVNSGDYATYTFNCPKTADYEIIYFISSPSNNAEITSLIDNVVVSTDNVINNNEWDDYIPLKAQGTVNLTVGTHSLRIEASGSNTWQWNLEHIELREVTGLSVDKYNRALNKMQIFPNPSHNKITLLANINDAFKVSIFNIQGGLISEVKVNGFPYEMSIKDLSEGLYLLKVSNQKASKIFKLIKSSKD